MLDIVLAKVNECSGGGAVKGINFLVKRKQLQIHEMENEHEPGR